MFCRILNTCLFFFLISYCCGQQVSKKASPQWLSSHNFSLEINNENNPTGGFYYLLIERQLNLFTQERYNRSVIKILSSEGVQEMSDISADFDPEYETLTFNSINLYRDGKKINKLSSSEIKIVQREQSMERYLYDGSKTAYINLSDVRIGDVIEYSYTRKGYNPVFKDHFSEFLYFEFSFPYQKFYQRLVVPNHKELYFHYKNGEITPAITKTSKHQEYVWTLENINAVLTDNNTPGWYDPYRYVGISDFKSWKEVKDWGMGQFTVSADQMNKVKRKLPAELLVGSLEERLLKSIRFVQDEVRYLGFENGVHSHQPHNPEKVLDQRFGDCKDKSLLLVVIARIQGVEASPVFVNTSIRNKIDEEPPTYFGFDHCVAQIKYGEQELFIDPTINDQGGALETIYFPYYSKGLVINSDTQGLSVLSQSPTYGTTEEQIFELAEIGKSAHMTVRTTYVGKDADSQRSEFSGTDLETTQKNYRTFYANSYPDIKVVKPLSVKDDRGKNILVVEEYYVIEKMWSTKDDSGSKIYSEFYPQSIDRLVSIEKSTQRKSPYRLTYPLSFKHITQIKLPETWNVKNDNKIIESDYYRFSNQVIYEGLEIKIINEYQTKAFEIPADFIKTFVNDHEKIVAELNYVLSYDSSIDLTSQSSTQPSYPIIVVLLASVFGAVLVIRLYRYNPERRYDYTQQIGGWLILPAIGLCITPIMLILTLIDSENSFFNQSTWASLLTNEQYGLLFFMGLELAYNIVAIFFTGLLILLFFQKRTSLPTLILFFYGVSFVVVTGDSVVLAYFTDEPFSNSWRDIIRSLISAAIWIPYFLKSERVKETFNVRL